MSHSLPMNNGVKHNLRRQLQETVGRASISRLLQVDRSLAGYDCSALFIAFSACSTRFAVVLSDTEPCKSLSLCVQSWPLKSGPGTASFPSNVLSCCERSHSTPAAWIDQTAAGSTETFAGCFSCSRPSRIVQRANNEKSVQFVALGYMIFVNVHVQALRLTQASRWC